MSLVLLKNSFRQARKIGSANSGQKLVALLSLFVTLIFMLFLNFTFYYLFKELKTSNAGPGSLIYLLNQIFFLLFVLVVFSSGISGLPIFFQSKEVTYLLSLPLKIKTIFNYLLAKYLIVNSWPIIVAGLPLAFSYAFAMKLNIMITLLLVAALLPLTLMAEAVGVVLVFLLGTFYHYLKNKIFVFFMVLLTFVTAFYLADIITPLKFPQLSTEKIGAHNITFISNLKLNHPFLISYWVALIYKSALAASYNLLIQLLSVLAASILILLGVKLICSRFYLNIWYKTQETTSNRQLTRGQTFPRFFSSLKGALIERDYRLFLRNTNEVYQAIFILLVVFIFIFVVSKLPYLNINLPLWRYRLVILLYGTICYFLAMVANRFVFPSLSMEGRSFWVLLSVPFSLRSFYWARLVSSVAFLAFFSSILFLLSAYFYQLNVTLALILYLLTLLASITIVVINLSLGTLYPDFTRDNPSEISSGLTGLLAAVFSLSYGAAGMVLIRPLVAAFIINKENFYFCLLLAYLLFSLAAIFIFSSKALKKLDSFSL